MKMARVSPTNSQARMQLAKILAGELAMDGIADVLALPVAIHLLAAVQCALDAGPAAAQRYLDASRRQSEDWWLRNHPGSRTARRIRQRRREDGAPSPPAGQ